MNLRLHLVPSVSQSSWRPRMLPYSPTDLVSADVVEGQFIRNLLRPLIAHDAALIIWVK